MSPEEQQELARLRWQFEKLQRLAEDWRGNPEASDIHLECAAELDAILKKRRSIIVALFPSVIALVVTLLILALVVCHYRHG